MNICIMLLVASIGLYVNICIMLLAACSLYVNICIMLLVAFDRPLCEYLYNAACRPSIGLRCLCEYLYNAACSLR